MPRRNTSNRISNEAAIQAAIADTRAKMFRSLNQAAEAYNVPYSTVLQRSKGTRTRAEARQSQQALTPDEEDTMERWITRLARAGYPIAPSLALQLGSEIRAQRPMVGRVTGSTPLPLLPKWLNGFKKRHPSIAGVWDRKIHRVRYQAMTRETVMQWFDAVSEMLATHHHPPHRIYNMDESGFAIGESQTSRVLVNIRDGANWSQISGRSEWLTSIDCVSASGVALPPMIIYKAKHLYSGWVPDDAPPNWRWSTSNKGWTSHSHAFEWISTLFEPETRPESDAERRLLILDGHSSHLTASFIRFCMEHSIDLMVLPPHATHVLQPLDVAIFGPLKRCLAVETDKVSRYDSHRIPRSEWAKMLVRARSKTMTPENVRSGFRTTGLAPFHPERVLRQLPDAHQHPAPSTSQTQDTGPMKLDQLRSSPPEDTMLHDANEMMLSALDSCEDLPEAVRRYARRMAMAYEKRNTELIIARRDLATQRQLLEMRKQVKRGKRVSLEGKYVLTTQETLDKVVELEQLASAKKAKKTPKKTPKKPSPTPLAQPLVISEDELSDSDDMDWGEIDSRINAEEVF
jgi:hypothetical protein